MSTKRRLKKKRFCGQKSISGLDPPLPLFDRLFFSGNKLLKLANFLKERRKILELWTLVETSPPKMDFL